MKKINTICPFPYFQMHRDDKRTFKSHSPTERKKTPPPQNIQERERKMLSNVGAKVGAKVTKIYWTSGQKAIRPVTEN